MCQILEYFELPQEQILIHPFENINRLKLFLDEHKKITGIYCINAEQLKSCYIGQSINLKQRLLIHFKYYNTKGRYREARSSQQFYDFVKQNSGSLILYILEKNIHVLGRHEQLWRKYFRDFNYDVYG